jgi:hypothetical protein
MIPFGKITAALSIMGMIGGGFVFGRPLLISDPPPWESVANHRADNNELQGLIIQGQISDSWTRFCNAMRAKDTSLANVHATHLADLKNDYLDKTKRVYLTEPCP